MLLLDRYDHEIEHEVDLQGGNRKGISNNIVLIKERERWWGTWKPTSEPVKMGALQTPAYRPSLAFSFENMGVGGSAYECIVPYRKLKVSFIKRCLLSSSTIETQTITTTSNPFICR